MFTTVSLKEVLRYREMITTLFKAYNLEIPSLAIDRRDRVELAVNNLPSFQETAEICTYLLNQLKTKVDILMKDNDLKTIPLDASESELRSFFRAKDLKNVEFKTKEIVFHDQFNIRAAQEKLDLYQSGSIEASPKIESIAEIISTKKGKF